MSNLLLGEKKLCPLCGEQKPADKFYKCKNCGLLVCKSCFSSSHGTCVKCLNAQGKDR